MKTILVPTDFTPAAVAAAKYAATLSKKFKSTIILLHVIEAVDEGSFNIEGEAVAKGSWEDRLFNMKMIEKARKDMARAASALTDQGVNVKSVLRVGDAYHGIQSIIAEQKTDLVVMGTEGDSGNANILIGSTTEKVLRRSACPVICVNRKTTVGSLRSVVWATSLNNEDMDMPPALKQLINDEDIMVHVVRVNTPSVFLADADVKKKLKTVAEFLKLKNYTINVYNDFEEVTGVIRFAATVDADLIAMSTHGRQGLAHILNGSIAEDVINHTRRPVMTYVIGRKAKK